MEMNAMQTNAILEDESIPVQPADSFGRLERQMRALSYTWHEYVKDGGRMAAAAASLENQLIDLYQEREQAGGLSYEELKMTVEGLNAQLHSLYEDREGSTEECQVLRETVKNFETQLASLYQDREHADYLSRFPVDVDVAAAARSFEEQLHAIYEEQSKARYGISEANIMADSLEQQVAALLEERDELADTLTKARQTAAEQRSKARDLITAVFERAITA